MHPRIPQIVFISLLTALFEVNSAGQADAPASVGEWSMATNGLRARLAFGEGDIQSETRVGLLYLELQNVSHSPLCVPFFELAPPIRCELRDAAGNALEASVSGFDGPVAPATGLVLPGDSVLRFRLNVDAAGVPREKGLFVPGGGGFHWMIPPNATNDYFLSGTLTAKKDDELPILITNTKSVASASKPDHVFIWEGALKVPPVRLPVRIP